MGISLASVKLHVYTQTPRGAVGAVKQTKSALLTAICQRQEGRVSEQVAAPQRVLDEPCLATGTRPSPSSTNPPRASTRSRAATFGVSSCCPFAVCQFLFLFQFLFAVCSLLFAVRCLPVITRFVASPILLPPRLPGCLAACQTMPWLKLPA